MNEDSKPLLQDIIVEWRRSDMWDASQVFARVFAVASILHVAINRVWNGAADYEAAFTTSLIFSGALAILSMVFKIIPVFRK